MLMVLVVEDSERLQPALVAGLKATGRLQVLHAVASGEAASACCLPEPCYRPSERTPSLSSAA